MCRCRFNFVVAGYRWLSRVLLDENFDIDAEDNFEYIWHNISCLNTLSEYLAICPLRKDEGNLIEKIYLVLRELNNPDCCKDLHFRIQYPRYQL